MRKRLKQLTIYLLTASLTAQALLPARGAEPFYKTFNFLIRRPSKAIFCREAPETETDDAVQTLAREIDWLEHHIDAFGTVVAKQPDVWGQSRLTRHREDVEKRLYEQLDLFQDTLNGALTRSDQSYLAMAFSLQSALGSGQSPPSSTGLPVLVNSLQGMLTPGATLDPTSGAPSPSAPIVQGTAPFQALAGANTPKFDVSTISLEPTVHLDQLKNYLDHLNELRRTNEGDDTADSPGYALDLVRIPVSIMPGKHTRRGYGAEITVIAEPYLSPELLPITFRNLVIKDVLDQVAPIVTYYANTAIKHGKTAALANADNGAGSKEADTQSDGGSRKSAPSQATSKMMKMAARTRQLYEVVASGPPPVAKPAVGTKSRNARMPMPPSQVCEVLGKEYIARVTATTELSLKSTHLQNDPIHLMDVRAYLTEEIQAAYEFLCSNERVGLWQEFCGPELSQAIRSGRLAAVCDMRRNYLRALPDDVPADGVGAQRNTKPGIVRTSAVEEIVSPSADCADDCDTRCSREQIACSITAALGWAILVESALLNERLVQDMREAVVSKGCDCDGLNDLCFYGPDPSPAAREEFAAYVRCRWPIHIFAIDPVTQDQNIQDEFSRRRETQLALALAFAGGNISAGTMMRYTRHLEWDMSTIALNRTQAAFSHGSDTFGWRFYPRFQSPPIKGNISALYENFFGGPTTDQDTFDRELEPGMRECTAIVVMPSFVPYVTFDVRSNWFKLTNPKQSEISTTSMVKLSRSIKAMQNSAAQCAQVTDTYRDGEIARLLRRVTQLDRELPLQTMQVQIPYENSLGGFEMFNTGITDLAPSLLGWYGDPGVDPHGTTRLFLIGDRFAIHDTHVIAGGQLVEFHLLSRQVMEVIIPPGVQVVEDPESADHRQAVDVHLATAYGATGHLLIPLAEAPATLAGGDEEGFELQKMKIQMFYTTAKSGTDPNITVTATVNGWFDANPQEIRIRIPRSPLPPPDNPGLLLSITSGKDHLGDITVASGSATASMQYDARTGEYYLPALNFVPGTTGSVASLLTTYLNYLLATPGKKVPNPLDLRISATLIPGVAPSIPVRGKIAVAVTQALAPPAKSSSVGPQPGANQGPNLALPAPESAPPAGSIIRLPHPQVRFVPPPGVSVQR